MIIRAGRTLNPAAVSFLGGGLLCTSLGNLFYILHYMLLGEIARTFSAADIAWIGSYLFIIGAHQLLNWEKRRAPMISWIAAAFSAAVLVIVTVLYGNAAVNIIWGVPFCTLTWFCGCGLAASGNEPGKERLHHFYILLMGFIVSESALFLTWGIGYVIADASLLVTQSAMAIVFYRENLPCT